MVFSSCPVCRSGFVVFTFNTASGQFIIPTAEVNPVHGGQLRVSGYMDLSASAEHNPSAIQMDFSGSGFDIASANAYLGDIKDAEFLRESTGRLRVRGNMTGAHSAPVNRFNIESQDRPGQCLVLLTRDRAAMRLRAPALDVSASALTEFPDYETQKEVLTQEDAVAMRAPRYLGGSLNAHVRRVDAMPLVRALLDASGHGGDTVAIGEGEAVVNGQVKLLVRQLHESSDTSFDGHDTAEAAVEAQLHEQGRTDAQTSADAAQQESERPEVPEQRDFVGKLEIKGARVNQLNIVSGLDGNFTVSDGRLKLHAEGRQARERLHIDANLAALMRAMQEGSFAEPVGAAAGSTQAAAVGAEASTSAAEVVQALPDHVTAEAEAPAELQSQRPEGASLQDNSSPQGPVDQQTHAEDEKPGESRAATAELQDGRGSVFELRHGALRFHAHASDDLHNVRFWSRLWHSVSLQDTCRLYAMQWCNAAHVH